ncbi:MAG: hypothetical protein CK428_05040 [Mycobacterium sp.]|nr:MAG: hypothetical protein CK428_05040 [Mycobacterium sp.]
MDEPVAESLNDLATHGHFTMEFCGGTTPLGHRWELRRFDGSLLARTARVHRGGAVAQRLWKLVVLTGMDAGNDIHVELRGARGAVLARISSINEKPAPVTVSNPDGRLIAKSVHHKDDLTVYGADDCIVARLACQGDGPWPVNDAKGAVIGQLVGGEPGPSVSPQLSELLVSPQTALNSAAYNNSQHLGLRRVTQYRFITATEGPAPMPVALLPLLAGLTY